MKHICIVTATRAEFGLLCPLIKALKRTKRYDVRVVATGTHLSPEFGLTYQEIEKEGISIDRKIEILLSADTPSSVSKSMGLALIGFADYFDVNRPDLLVILGDRYESLAVCSAAMNFRIPIAHLYGGETTEGAVDECVRHAITKMSYLHFTSTEAYRKRVIQMGEAPNRVFNVGAIGVENISKLDLLSKTQLSKEINFNLNKPYAVLTFHPVTLEANTAKSEFQEILSACDAFPNLKYIFTKSNADAGGRIINQMIDDYSKRHENIYATESLGSLKYLSALKYAEFLLGNSSSGLTEAPSFAIPTINIGDRQKGRIQGNSIINCLPEQKMIESAIQQALDLKKTLNTYINPYKNGESSEKIVEVLNEILQREDIDLKKKFYDIPFKNDCEG